VSTEFGRFGLVLVLISLNSCTPKLHMQEPPKLADRSEFELVVRERFEEKRFELHLNSKTERALCFQTYSWPNALGQLHFAGSSVHVTVNNTDYPIQDRNFGYCVPVNDLDCYKVLPVGGSVYGFIAFSEFDQAMYAEPNAVRILQFKVPLFPCAQVRQ
jgi:hypothetical protein